MLSTGSAFAAPVQWSNTAFYGRIANHIGDVNGDGRDDLIVQNEADTHVMLSRPDPPSAQSHSGPTPPSTVASPTTVDGTTTRSDPVAGRVGACKRSP